MQELKGLFIKENIVENDEFLNWYSFYNKGNNESFFLKGNEECEKINFLMEEVYSILKKDLDGAYGLINIMRDINLPNSLEKYIDFSHQVIRDKWSKKLDSEAHVIVGNNHHQSLKFTNLIISNNKFEALTLTKYNHLNIIKELKLINDVLLCTEEYINKNLLSHRLPDLIKLHIFKELKIMRLYQTVEKKLENKKTKQNDEDLLKEIFLIINNNFKKEISKINKAVFIENDNLIINKTVSVENNKSLIFNKLKKYSLNYRKSILFRDVVFSVGEDIIIEQKCYNKNIVNIKINFIKEYPEDIKEYFIKGLELIMHELKNSQISYGNISENALKKDMNDKINTLFREINLKHQLNELSIKQICKKRKKI